MHRLIFSTSASEGTSRSQERDSAKGPVLVDKFFLLSALIAIFAAAGWGVHLWLMLNGWMKVSSEYARLRSFHAILQFEGFFGPIVLGFLLQTAPRFFKLPVNPRPQLALLALCAALGALVLRYFPAWEAWKYLVSAPYILGMAYLVELFSISKRRRAFLLLRWFLLSLAAFAAGPFLSIEQPHRALFLFLAGVASLLTAVGQHFMFADIKTKRFSSAEEWGLWTVFMLGLVTLWIAGDGKADSVSSAVFFGIIFYFLVRSDALPRLFSRKVDIRSIVYGCALLWALVGASVLLLKGIAYADVVFHIWALGWAVPIMLTVARRVLRANGGGLWIEERYWLFVMVLWQLVPFGRAGLTLWPLPGWFSLAVGIVVGIIFSLWLYTTVRSAIRLNLSARFL